MPSSPVCSLPRLLSPEHFENPEKQLEWSWGAAANDCIHGNHVGNSTAAGIRNAKLSPIRSTIAHGDNDFGVRHGIVGALKGSLHMPRDRTRYQQKIRYIMGEM